MENKPQSAGVLREWMGSNSKERSLLGASLFFLLVLAFCHRFSWMFAPFQQDEYAHFIVVIQARHLVDMMARITPNLQPILDYLMLRCLWIPIFGSKELALRLPSLIFSLATQAFVFLAAYRFLQKRLESGALAWFFALLVGLWAAGHDTEGHLAGVARHYAMVASLSAVWWFFYIAEEVDISGRFFFFLSLIFANAHFFALLLIAGAYGIELCKFILRPEIRSASLRTILRLFFFPLAILALTVAVNFSAFHMLVTDTPTAQPYGTGVPGLLNAAHSILDAWKSLYTEYVDWPFGVFTLGIALFLPFIPGVGKISRHRYWASLLVFQPAFYFILRFRSSYYFGPRYHSVFYGFAFVSVLLLFCAAASLFLKYKGKPKALAVPALLAFGTISLLLTLKGISPGDAPEKLRWFLSGKHQNFSDNFLEQKYVQERRLPILWVHEACWESDNPFYYLGHNAAVLSDPNAYSKAYSYGFLVLDSAGCETSKEYASAEVSRFFQIHGANTVVLREKAKSRESCVSMRPKLPAYLSLELMPKEVTDRCVWVVSGAKKWADVKLAADQLQFPYFPGFFPKE